MMKRINLTKEQKTNMLQEGSNTAMIACGLGYKITQSFSPIMKNVFLALVVVFGVTSLVTYLVTRKQRKIHQD